MSYADMDNRPLHGHPRPEVERPSWQQLAACRGQGTRNYFPENGGSTIIACAVCPVTAECLEYALEHRIDHGTWGGVSERGRRRMLRARRGRAS